MRSLLRLTLASLASIPQRWGDALNIVVCSALVVTVLASTLMMVRAIEKTVSTSTRPDWQIILRTGAPVENMSDISEASLDLIRQFLDSDSKYIEAHFVTTVVAARAQQDIDSTVQVRGVAPLTKKQTQFRIIQGRDIEAGKFELIVADTASAAFAEFNIGDTVALSNQQWRIVGIFQSTGLANSELWADRETLMNAFGNKHYSSLRVQLDPDRAEKLHHYLESETRLQLETHKEDEFFQVGSSVKLFEFVAYAVSVIMAIGASFAVMNVMFTSIERRLVEIATLRALGFGRLSIVTSVLVEALIISVAGGLLGLAVCIAYFQGDMYTAGTSTSISAVLTLTPEIATTSFFWAGGIGLLAGIPPAIRAARLPISLGLRWEG